MPTLLERLLASTHLIVPDDLPDLVAEHARELGALDTSILLVDREQRWLVALPRTGRERDLDRSIDETAAGGHHDGQLQDDATVVAVEWRGGGPSQLTVR